MEKGVQIEVRMCVFDSSKVCQVKQSFKLTPESLVEFCKLCKPQQADKMQSEMIMQFVMQMNSQQRDLGEKAVRAEIYERLYRELKDKYEPQAKARQ